MGVNASQSCMVAIIAQLRRPRESEIVRKRDIRGTERKGGH